MRRALIIETAFVGDAVISTALAVELRRLEPSIGITYLVRPDTADLLRTCPAINEIVVFDKHGEDAGADGLARIASMLNASRFDFVYALHGSKRTELLVAKLNAPIKVSYSEAAAFTHKVSDDCAGYRSSRAIGLLRATHAGVNLRTLPLLNPEAARDSPQAAGDPPQAQIVISPASVWATKEWTVEGFAEVARHFTQAGFKVLLTGTEKDAARCRAIHDSVASELCIDFSGKLTLPELSSQIAAAKLLIANDSAPLHIGLAVRMPSVGIFGPTVPSMGFAPPEPHSTIVGATLWCRPCSPHGSRECPKHDHECMTIITHDMVIAAAGDMLSRNLPA